MRGSNTAEQKRPADGRAQAGAHSQAGGHRQSSPHSQAGSHPSKRGVIDLALGISLLVALATGHGLLVVHELAGLCFVVLLVAHCITSHRHLMATAKAIVAPRPSVRTKVDCCLGLLMLVATAVVVVSGANLMHAIKRDGVSELALIGTPAFVAHAIAAIALLCMAAAHIWINREKIARVMGGNR